MEQHLNKSHIWVFGYGSLIWRPNFVYAERIVGHVEGFERRFWQGSVYHRGSNERPGRVATLVENKNSRVWGVCYKVQGAQNIRKALGHLKIRERHYETRILEFRANNNKKENQSLLALVFYAAPGNECFLGQESNLAISKEICFGYGVSGSNIEYLFRLADFMRDELSIIKDDHLFEIERLVRHRLGLCTQNIISWIELIKTSHFIDALRNKNMDVQNMLTV